MRVEWISNSGPVTARKDSCGNRTSQYFLFLRKLDTMDISDKRFDPRKLDRLNNPERYKALSPEFIAEKAGLGKPEVIIDLGAGTGFYSIPFAKMYESSKIYALDISDIMIDWMVKNLSHDYSNIIPLKINDNEIPLDAGIADFLFMINLHHELESPGKMLGECSRVLKSTGKIAISDWKKIETEHGPPIEIRYKAEEVEEQLIAAGFRNIRVFNLATNFLIIADKY